MKKENCIICKNANHQSNDEITQKHRTSGFIILIFCNKFNSYRFDWNFDDQSFQLEEQRLETSGCWSCISITVLILF
jgi:hypothetical protein